MSDTTLSEILAVLHRIEAALQTIANPPAKAETPVVGGDDWMTVSQAAEISGIDKGTISRACTTGKLNHCDKGRDRRINPDAIWRSWATNHRRGAAARSARKGDAS